jgi:hypothetical protein
MTTVTIDIPGSPPPRRWDNLPTHIWFLDNQGDLCIKVNHQQLFCIARNSLEPAGALYERALLSPSWHCTRLIDELIIAPVFKEENS